MSSVYLVTSGSYSDYHVCAVFSTEEKAKAWVATAPDKDEYEIEAEELDPEAVDGVGGHGSYEAFIYENGELAQEPPYRHYDPVKPPESMAWWRKDFKGTVSDSKPGDKVLCFRGWGKTAEHARRSAEQLRRETLSNPVLLADSRKKVGL